MSKTSVKIKFISKGFEEILCSPGAGNLCAQIAEKIQQNANAGLDAKESPGFKSGGRIGEAYKSKRWVYFVYTTDLATMKAEAEDQTLSKAVKG